MNLAEFKETVLRLERMHERVQNKAGTSFEWSAVVSSGEENVYSLVGVKPFAEMLDDVLNAYIWAWGIKDALKPYASSSGKSENWYEATLTANKCLSICSDIANRAKHGSLKKSRGGQFAKLGELTYSIPQSAVAALSFGAKSVTTVVEKPELVSLALPVIDLKGRRIGDGFRILECAIHQWELLAADLGLKLPPVKMSKSFGKP